MTSRTNCAWWCGVARYTGLALRSTSVEGCITETGQTLFRKILFASSAGVTASQSAFCLICIQNITWFTSWTSCLGSAFDAISGASVASVNSLFVDCDIISSYTAGTCRNVWCSASSASNSTFDTFILTSQNKTLAAFWAPIYWRRTWYTSLNFAGHTSTILKRSSL